jgi:hypothetical protein
MMVPTVLRLLGLSLLVGLVACAEPAVEVPKAAPVDVRKVQDFREFLPIEDGRVYAYHVEDKVANTVGALMLRVQRDSEDLATLTSGGSNQTPLMFDTHGIMRRDTRMYMLRGPIQEGTTWSLERSRQFRITAVDKTMKVLAGTFPHCVEVTEARTGKVEGIIVTVFCHKVGIVLMETKGIADGKIPIHERLELRSVGKAIDINHLPPDEK